MRTLLPQREWGRQAPPSTTRMPLEVMPRNQVTMMPNSEVSALGKRQGLISESTSSASALDTSWLQEMLLKSITDARESMDIDGKIGSYYTRSGDGPDDWYVGTIPPESVTIRNPEVVLAGGVNNAITVAVQDADNGTGRQWILRVNDGPPMMALQTEIVGHKEYLDGSLIGDVGDSASGALLPIALMSSFMTFAALMSFRLNQARAKPAAPNSKKQHDTTQEFDGLDEEGYDRHGCQRRVRLGREQGFDGEFEAHVYNHDYECTPLLGVPAEHVITREGLIKNFPIPCISFWPIPTAIFPDIDVLDCCKKHDTALYCSTTLAEAAAADVAVVSCFWDAIWTAATEHWYCHPHLTRITNAYALWFWNLYIDIFKVAYLAAIVAAGFHKPCYTSGGHHKNSCLCGGTEPTARIVNGKWVLMDCPGKGKCPKCRLVCQYDEDDIYAVGWRFVNPEPWKKCCPGTDRESLESAAGDLKSYCPDKCSSTCKWVCEQWIMKGGQRWKPNPDPWKLDTGNHSLPCCGGAPPKPPPEQCPVVEWPPVPNDSQRGVE